MLARGLQASLGAFDHYFQLHLGQGRHDDEEKAPGDRGAAKRVGEADEPYSAFVQAASEVQEVFHSLAHAF